MNDNNTWTHLWHTMRPRHWVKNVLIFAPMVFAMEATNGASLLKTFLAFVLFNGLVGAGYLFNDVLDRENDRLHKVKANRPIARDLLAPATALSAGVLLFAVSITLSFALNKSFGYVALAFAIIQVLYSLVLKHIVIVDLFAVAAGYVLRVVAGGVVIPVEISNWLLICAMLLSLFIALSKRSLELRFLAEDAVHHRPTLAEYNLYLLDQMTAVITSALLVAYTLYTRSPDTIMHFATPNLIYTVPFVLYGIFRYLYLVHIKEGYHTLERVLITDKPMIINMALYVIVVALVLYA